MKSDPPKLGPPWTPRELLSIVLGVVLLASPVALIAVGLIDFFT